jgi:thymidylate synthase
MVQRSADMVLGVPHNWVQYWAFLMWICKLTDKKIGTFHWHGIDCHIYMDHYNMARRMINEFENNKSKLFDIDLCYYNIDKKYNKFNYNDFWLSNEYNPIINESLKMTV